MQDLHKGPSINLLLEVVELCFKGSPQSRTQSFLAWRSLIDNFALDQGIVFILPALLMLMLISHNPLFVKMELFIVIHGL